MKEKVMEKVQEWNRKYQVLVGVIIVTIIGTIFGIGRHIDFKSSGIPSNYRFNLDAPVNSRIWIGLLLYIGLYHLYQAKKNTDKQKKDISKKQYFVEMIEISVISMIEIIIMYILYLTIGFGNVFTVIPIGQLALLFVGLCLCGVITNLLMYVLLVIVGDLKKAIIIGMILLVLVININSSSMEIGGLGYNINNLVNPVHHAMEYDRIVYYYYDLDGKVSEIVANSHTNFLLIIMVQMALITGLSLVGYEFAKNRESTFGNVPNTGDLGIQDNMKESKEENKI